MTPLHINRNNTFLRKIFFKQKTLVRKVLLSHIFAHPLIVWLKRSWLITDLSEPIPVSFSSPLCTG